MPTSKEQKIDHLSYSSVRDYLNCPRNFYLKHILKIRPKQKQMNLVFGGAVHDGIEAYHNGYSHIGVFDRSFDNKKLLPEELAEFDYHKEEGHRLLDAYVFTQAYMTDYLGIDPTGRSEVKFEVMLSNPMTKDLLGVKLTGRIDRITNGNQILEFKTSSKPYKQADVDVELQASLYDMVHLMQTDELATGIFYVVLIKGRKKDPIQILKTTRTKEQLVQSFKTLELVLKGINSNQFERGKGWFHDKFCDCFKIDEQLLL